MGDSPASDITEIALADFPSAPFMPVKVNAESSLTSIHLNWNVVSDTQINVLGYQVYMDSGSNGQYTMVFDGKNRPGVRSFTAENLQ